MPDTPAITRRRRRGTNQLRPSFPRLPGIIPVVLSVAFFQDHRTATVLSRNEEEVAAFLRKNKEFLLHNLFTDSAK